MQYVHKHVRANKMEKIEHCFALSLLIKKKNKKNHLKFEINNQSNTSWLLTDYKCFNKMAEG